MQVPAIVSFIAGIAYMIWQHNREELIDKAGAMNRILADASLQAATYAPSIGLRVEPEQFCKFACRAICLEQPAVDLASLPETAP